MLPERIGACGGGGAWPRPQGPVLLPWLPGATSCYASVKPAREGETTLLGSTHEAGYTASCDVKGLLAGTRRREAKGFVVGK